MHFHKVFAFLGLHVLYSAWAIEPPVIQTKSGPIKGKYIQFGNPEQGVYQFTSIPFAEPPLGDLRFKKPVPKKPWTSVLDGTSLTKMCMQVGGGGGDPNNPYAKFLGNFAIPGVQESEDCLYLNVWVPRTTLDAVANSTKTYYPLSVYIYIHGGSYIAGTTMWTIFNGTVLSGSNNVVVVTIQYRLGAFGFAYFGKTDDASTNVGLWDQMEAMKWVKNNIDAFGGNASQVTIGGESAGAGSVALHLLSPESRNYFQRAIIESGSGIAPWAIHTPAVAKMITDTVAKQTPCGASFNNDTTSDEKLKCLRSVDAKTLAMIDAVPLMMGFTHGSIPVVDGDFVPRNPARMIMSGDFYRAPLLIGTNRNEGSHLMLNNPEMRTLLPGLDNPRASLDNLNMTHYDQLWQSGVIFVGGFPMPNGFDSLLSTAIRLNYWPTCRPGFPTGPEIAKAASEITSDYAITCPTVNWVNLSSEYFDASNVSVYMYRFTHRPSAMPLPEWMGVVHGAELPFVFGDPFSPAGLPGYNDQDKTLSKMMMEYWANFVKYGDPNRRDPCTLKSSPLQASAYSLRKWPTYHDKNCISNMLDISVLTQVYNYGDAVTCGLKARDCSFWHDLFERVATLVTPEAAALNALALME